MKEPPPRPNTANNATPPMPDTTARYEALVKSLYAPPEAVPSSWVGSRPGAIGIHSENADISPSPQETTRRRQGSDTTPSDRRTGPVREQGGGWTYAPGTSHISRFTFVPTPGGGLNLTVVFKGPNNSGEVAEYLYSFDDYDTGMDIFNRMRRSPHPYGFVLYPDVIQANVQYHLLARS
jgi:hypothetical protein